MDPLKDLQERFELDEDTQKRVRPIASAAMFGALVLVAALLRRKDLRVRENVAALGANVNHAAQGLAQKFPFLPKPEMNDGAEEKQDEEHEP